MPLANSNLLDRDQPSTTRADLSSRLAAVSQLLAPMEASMATEELYGHKSAQEAGHCRTCSVPIQRIFGDIVWSHSSPIP
jgi:hypothetical protein